MKKNIFSINEESIVNPENIEISIDLIIDSRWRYDKNDAFCIFKSINNIICLIYQNKFNSIISYNLNYNKIICEIKNLYKIKYYRNRSLKFSHYLDSINKRDLILISNDNNLKLLNANNFEKLLDCTDSTLSGYISAAKLIKENNLIYILLCINNYNIYNNNYYSPIKTIDIKNQIHNEIKDSFDNAVSLDSYYNTKLSKTFIVTGNYGYSKSYDFNENKLYYKYLDKEGPNFVREENGHLVIINDKKNPIELIESCWDGFIRIWNFDLGLILKKIKIFEENKYQSICLWNINYLFVGCVDKTIKLIDLNKGEIIKEIKSNDEEIFSIRKIFLRKYGECLISYAIGNNHNKIKLWTKKI